MKILVIGCGAQGSVICTVLVKSPEVSEVRVADIDLEKAKRFAGWLKSEKLSPLRVDADNPDELLRAIKGVDVVVNAALPMFNLKIMQAALKSGAHYQDLALGSPPPFEKALSDQLALSGKFKDAGLTALIDTGTAPGIMNVVAREAADKLDQVEEIRMRWYLRVESDEPISIWSPETQWFDLKLKPLLYENGKLKKVPPFSGEEVYKFPEPIGPQTVFHQHHEEVITLSRFIGKGLKYVDFKAGGPHVFTAKAFDQLGMFNEKPIDVKGTKVAPLDVLVALTPPVLSPEETERKIKAGKKIIEEELFLVEVKGQKEGEETRHTFHWYSDLHEAREKCPAANVESYPTGTAAAIFAKLLGRGDIKTRGVIPPECLGPEARKKFLAELDEKGITIYKGVEKL